ncbi:MAG: hypothetical protein A4E66_02427 [Syntrophus sp. PtaB.Bin001]|nr:MAG: hypothetical protein A4E66_02427 [Syntrophus sp. PtaB.Bin001]
MTANHDVTRFAVYQCAFDVKQYFRHPAVANIHRSHPNCVFFATLFIFLTKNLKAACILSVHGRQRPIPPDSQADCLVFFYNSGGF